MAGVNKLKRLVLKTVFMGALCWALMGYAHKFHASLTQLEFNQETGSAEVALRLFADDLENSLSKQAGTRITLDADQKLVASEAMKYLSGYFQLKTPDKVFEAKWVGMEFDVHVVWVYLEIPIPKDQKDLQLVNSIFFDQFKDQVNTVTLKKGDLKKTLVFKPGDRSKAIQF